MRYSPTLLAVAAMLVSACSENKATPDARIPDLYGEHLGFPDGPVPESGFSDGAAPGDSVDPFDWDGDGISNDVEKQLGLDPNNKDTDNDGTDDGQEVGDPSAPTDSDGDGKIDAKEPDNFDSDLDGTPDSQDGDDTDGKCGKVKRLFLFDTLSQDTTLAKDCSPYKVLGQLTVNGGATLTVAADVTVTFGPGAALFLGDNTTKGGLNLAGTKDVYTSQVHPVLLTADSQQPQKGFWRGVVAQNGKLVVLSHATIEYGGGPTGSTAPQSLLLVSAADAITLNASTLRHATGFGLHAILKISASKLFLGFKGNSFSDLDHAAALNIRHLGEIEDSNSFGAPGAGGEVHVSEGTVDQAATWRSTGVPYVFEEPSININADLKIEAGVKLTLPANTAINVPYSGTGRLDALGSSTSPVIFTSQSGNAGSWQGILLSGGSNHLQHVRVIGAGKTSSLNVSAALYIGLYANVSVKDVVVTNSSADGVYYYRQGNGCSTVPLAEFGFAGSIAACGLFCIDDYNNPGLCLKQAP